DRQRPELRADALHRRHRLHLGDRMILSTIIWGPILVAIVLALLPGSWTAAIKTIGLLASVATFLVSVCLATNFQEGRAGFQFVESLNWIPQWGISYGLGVDGISLWLVLLTTL